MRARTHTHTDTNTQPNTTRTHPEICRHWCHFGAKIRLERAKIDHTRYAKNYMCLTIDCKIYDVDRNRRMGVKVKVKSVRNLHSPMRMLGEMGGGISPVTSGVITRCFLNCLFSGRFRSRFGFMRTSWTNARFCAAVATRLRRANLRSWPSLTQTDAFFIGELVSNVAWRWLFARQLRCRAHGISWISQQHIFACGIQ